MMKKIVVCPLFIISLVCFFTGCDDCKNEDNNEYYSILSGMYSNKSAALGKGELTLLYSNDEIFGKEIYFKQISEESADITLFGVIPGEKELNLRDIPLVKKESGYDFSETITTQSGESFSFRGEIQEGNLELEIDDLQLNNTILSAYSEWNVFVGGKEVKSEDEEGTYTYYCYTTHVEWTPFPQEDIIIRQIPDIIRNLLETIIYSTLKDISFKPDGNLTLTYANFPEDMNFISNIFLGKGYPDRPEEDWKMVPSSLITYYIKDSDLYLVPNAEMIMRWIQAGMPSTRSESESDTDLNLDLIIDAYGQLTKWFTEGIKLNIRNNPKQPYWDNQQNRVLYEGDILLVLDKSQLEAFLPLLPYVKNLLSEDVLNTSALIGGLTVGGLLDLVVATLEDADVFEIGLYLSKTTN